MAVGEAVAAALKAVVPPRRIVEAEELTHVPHSTLRRLMRGQKRVSAEVIERLRQYPGFSAAFDELAGNAQPAGDFLEVAKRFEASLDADGAALVAYQIERLARILSASEIANLLKSEANRLERVVAVAKSGE